MATPLIEAPIAGTTFALQLLLRNEKADYFALASTGPDRPKILNDNPDLQALFNMLNDLKVEKTKDLNSPELKNRLTNLFGGQGDEGELYYKSIELAIRNGLLDDASKIDIDKKHLEFNENKVKEIALEAVDVILDMDLPFTQEYKEDELEKFKPAPIENFKVPAGPVYHEAMNTLQSVYSENPTKSALIPKAIALDMANNAPEVQRAEIIAQVPSITGAAIFYASQERNITTPSEQAALPHISDKLVAMVLDDNLAITKLNERSQQVMNKMTHEINIENELG